MIPENTKKYRSSDSICPLSSVVDNQEILYPTEFLNILSFSSTPNHELERKVGAPIILLRNINQSIGLCTGIRLRATTLQHQVIEAKIITGSHMRAKVSIPRIVVT